MEWWERPEEEEKTMKAEWADLTLPKDSSALGAFVRIPASPMAMDPDISETVPL
jgi:hypothetical protein